MAFNINGGEIMAALKQPPFIRCDSSILNAATCVKGDDFENT
jgi:hypothetical protein